MPNPYFEFKRFTIRHDKCAMKVGTDGVLLGAWADASGCQTILDVGTGSGLIAIMLAQRYDESARITAIDIDPDAILQTNENVRESPFTNIVCKEISLQELAVECRDTYDHIVSNPPYFASSLKSPSEKRTLARHTDTLPVEDLIRYSEYLLSDKGRLSFIYPYQEKYFLLELAEKYGLYPTRLTEVLPTPASEPKRVLMELSRMPQPSVCNQLVIEVSRHVYSEEFAELAKDFYLKL
ncbi:tRNA1Val (adenine37-N6)-methyltransferase [Dysgonomonas sp. PH5-45]|uniref:tRNA1(Val) (adenine(37)-N6)-methyltransferase n=1 Tax=unclassified Dysgonomonas TaxID=2630389 RepID=UPI002476FFE9|nr:MULTISPECIES: methyltransferase [unclassified Dysgonomonas]MDH6353977.1 tRNA1Val (adenine37-N6)-methyltransferase [Dysgonomonas sp. PH5-45]MDH6386879.1 tRNA1Val (adenine37-N6)-methyltransferase [Dysgonomonas sp. PH5-37]